MIVQFKGDSRRYACDEPIEQKVMRHGQPVGWVASFHLTEDLDSAQLDGVLADKAITEIVFQADTEGARKIALVGYTTLNSCVIRHKEERTNIEIQLLKLANDSSGGENDG